MVQTPSSPIRVAISGKRWWKGFSAELTITNTSGRDLASWSTSFDTPHRITGSPWGVTLISAELGNGLTRYTLTGSGWGASLKAGASVKVGFNGSQGVGIGNEGALTAELLLAPGTAPNPGPNPPLPPSPPPAPAPEPLQVVVGGTRWWNGFTAELTITNGSSQDLTTWSTSFNSPHQLSGTPWGATLSRVDLGAGLTRYTLTGSGWSSSLKAGASVKVGFSGTQGISIGNEGVLTAAQLFGTVAPPRPHPVLQPLRPHRHPFRQPRHRLRRGMAKPSGNPFSSMRPSAPAISMRPPTASPGGGIRVCGMGATACISAIAPPPICRRG